MKRIVRLGLAVVSVLVALACVVLWPLSHFRVDRADFTRGRWGMSAASSKGLVVLRWYRFDESWSRLTPPNPLTSEESVHDIWLRGGAFSQLWADAVSDPRAQPLPWWNRLGYLRSADVDFLTIGQYLQPTRKHHAVVAFVPPDEFDAYEKVAYAKGFLLVSATPLTRSSHHAGDDFRKLRERRRG